MKTATSLHEQPELISDLFLKLCESAFITTAVELLSEAFGSYQRSAGDHTTVDLRELLMTLTFDQDGTECSTGGMRSNPITRHSGKGQETSP